MSDPPEVLLSQFQGNREGREIRPQSRCGNASQTPNPHQGGHSQSPTHIGGEGGGEAKCGVRTSALGSSPRRRLVQVPAFNLQRTLKGGSGSARPWPWRS